MLIRAMGKTLDFLHLHTKLQLYNTISVSYKGHEESKKSVIGVL